MRLTAERIEAFAGIFLSPRYDQPQPTPEFHRECWQRYCSSHPACATAAPRNHAKSTGLTHDFALACVCFRDEDYIIIVGSSEEMAIEHLGDIANELRENEELIREFRIKGFVQDSKTDIIVECLDGHQFRIIARGAEQKIRGRKWRGKRPGLILGDDLEDDEQVENKDRRRKFRRWFFRACKQALRDGGRIRVHGTILHLDSLLAHLMKNKTWNSKRYKAHKAVNDFSDILWPEKFPEARLRAIKAEFAAEGDLSGYSQEYLNDPQDDDSKYIKEEYFIPIPAEEIDTFRVYDCGVDFAISKKDSANRTSFTIGGLTIDNFLDIVDERVDRMDTTEIIDTFFEVNSRWSIRYFMVEDGQIWKTLKPTLEAEMRKRDIFFLFHELTPVQDKATRGRPMQKRMKSGSVRFNKETSWFPEYKDELLSFRVETEALLDDQFDSTATLVLGQLSAPEVEESDQLTEEELAFTAQADSIRSQNLDGRSPVTGY